MQTYTPGEFDFENQQDQQNVYIEAYRDFYGVEEQKKLFQKQQNVPEEMPSWINFVQQGYQHFPTYSSFS